MADWIEGVQMSRGLDMYNIRRRLSNRRIETELVDVNALFDSTLSHGENMANIEYQFGLRHGSDTRRAMESGPSRINKRRDRDGEFYQIGRTNERYDERRGARAPGFRRTDWGTSYIERRKNRSDRPGRRI